MKIQITNHAKQRYRERMLNGSHETNILPLMLKQIREGKDITDKLYDKIPRFILYLYEKYNELGQRIIQNNDEIFILKQPDKSIDVTYVLTCIKNDKYLSNFENTSLSREEIFLKISQIKNSLRKR